MATRDQVFEAINTERDYQQKRWGDDVQKAQPVAAFLTFMRHYLTLAEREASKVSGEAALEDIRKITALGVACMEAHGAPIRVG